VRDRATGRVRAVDGPDGLTPLQLRVMATDPELIRQAAHFVAEDEAARGHAVEVRVDAWLSLNGRPARLLVDPTVDLAAQPGRLGPHPWILDPE
jgi:vitamin K-dependent gamma-carboxylase